MKEYNYIKDCPDLDKIHLDVSLSLMTDKFILYCKWDEFGIIQNDLRIYFENELSESNKQILDQIIENNDNVL